MAMPTPVLETEDLVEPWTASRGLKVIVSNGAHQYHLLVAGEEMDRSGILSRFITCAYPGPRLSRILRSRQLSKSPKFIHLAERRGAIADERVSALWSSEVIIQVNPILRRVGQEAVAEAFSDAGFRWYARLAERVVRKASADVYHYRSGFGHESVFTARRNGMIALCDHSIVHPAILKYLIDNAGSFPATPHGLPVNSLWRSILQDVDAADHVLVNSEFVKRTFVFMGYPAGKIHVVYLGVDDKFLGNLPPRQPSANSNTLRLLFAGAMDKRKGGATLSKALERINDVPWTLEIIAHIDADLLQSHSSFFNNPRVTRRGLVTRKQLAAEMTKADAFVFPSLAEGSARVVFEALAAGCYVITTPNSGSIVETGKHGELVAPGSPDALESAIRSAAACLDRVRRIGEANARLVREEYTQRAYGQKLLSLYRHLTHNRMARPLNVQPESVFRQK
jgi:glycosyltransferase involved in cell wall biosynthesis